MPLELLRTYLPLAAIAAGVVGLVWSQRDRIGGLLDYFRSVPQGEPGMSPSERFPAAPVCVRRARLAAWRATSF